MIKRFTYVKNNSITQYQALPIQETGKSKALHCQGVVDKLNKLNDENEQLKQFKEDVFNKIDMHLRMLPTARDNVNGEYGDPSLYSGAIYMLETLKKELHRNDY